MSRRGRPPKRVRDRQQRQVCAWVTPAEHREVERTAARLGETVSMFVKAAIRAHLERVTSA